MFVFTSFQWLMFSWDLFQVLLVLLLPLGVLLLLGKLAVALIRPLREWWTAKKPAWFRTALLGGCGAVYLLLFLRVGVSCWQSGRETYQASTQFLSQAEEDYSDITVGWGYAFGGVVQSVELTEPAEREELLELIRPCNYAGWVQRGEDWNLSNATTNLLYFVDLTSADGETTWRYTVSRSGYIFATAPEGSAHPFPALMTKGQPVSDHLDTLLPDRFTFFGGKEHFFS